MTTSIAFELIKLLIPHCTENPICIFPEMKLRGLVPNSYIHVSLSDLYNPRISLPIWLQQNWKTFFYKHVLDFNNATINRLVHPSC